MADARTVTTSDIASASYAGILRNTYMLLSLTLVWSAVTAFVSMQMNAPYLGFATLIIYIALLFAVTKTQNSVWGLFWVFALTGFLGFTLVSLSFCKAVQPFVGWGPFENGWKTPCPTSQPF